jgi:hypothetical protein
MTDGRRQIWLSPPPFAPPSSVLRLPLSETNTYRARGRNALPDGDRWPRRDSRLDRRGQNLTKAALLGGRDCEVNWIGPLLRSRIRHGRALAAAMTQEGEHVSERRGDRRSGDGFRPRPSARRGECVRSVSCCSRSIFSQACGGGVGLWLRERLARVPIQASPPAVRTSAHPVHEPLPQPVVLEAPVAAG